jgi:hypothetical protein
MTPVDDDYYQPGMVAREVERIQANNPYSIEQKRLEQEELAQKQKGKNQSNSASSYVRVSCYFQKYNLTSDF